MGSSAPPAQVTLEPGTRLDRYELLCVLAHGGMANVWLARVQGKLGFQKLFAVKTILPNVADDAAFKTMFLDEARIASRIEHPNVVHMIDVGEVAKVAYLVMDLVEGEPLHKLPRACEKLGQRIPLGVVLRILADACHGLHAAHELRDEDGQLLNVVHRDMSPSNILVSASGVAKVIDFGVAKARDRSTGQTTVGTLKGKISYMPREQALGQDVDRRADTWALGAVLYYLLAGRPPYKEEQQLATLQLAMNGAPIPPLPVTLPVSLRAAVSRALAHEPSQRYQTAAEMGEALEQLMRKLGVATTHTQVGQFVQQVLGEKLESRKQLVASALAEAANRERARSTLTAASKVNDGADESGSHDQALIAVPTAMISVPRLMDGSEPITGSGPFQPGALQEHKTDPSTGAALAYGTTQGRDGRDGGGAPKKNLLVGLVAGTGLLALVGVALIAFSVRAGRHHGEKTASGSGSAAIAGSSARTGGAFEAAPEGAAGADLPEGSVSSPIAARSSEAGTPGAPGAPSASASANPRDRVAIKSGAGPNVAPQARAPGAPAPATNPATNPATTTTGKPKGREDYGF